MNDKQKRQYEARIWELKEALAVVADRLFATNHFLDDRCSPFDVVVENNNRALAEAKKAGWLSTFRPEVK